jgi:hypothetical protein
MTLYTFYGLFFSYQEVTCQKTAVANSYYSKPFTPSPKIKVYGEKKISPIEFGAFSFCMFKQ